MNEFTVTEVGSDEIRISCEGFAVDIVVTGRDSRGNVYWNFANYNYDMGNVAGRDAAIDRAKEELQVILSDNPVCAACRARHPVVMTCAEWEYDSEIPF